VTILAGILNGLADPCTGSFFDDGTRRQLQGVVISILTPAWTGTPGAANGSLKCAEHLNRVQSITLPSDAEGKKVRLVVPSHVFFGTAFNKPRRLYLLAAATPESLGNPILVDATLNPKDPGRIQHGGAVDIGIHTGNALRGYEIGKRTQQRGAYFVFGGVYASLYPEGARLLWSSGTMNS
jgi:hypothetical protein